MNRALRALFSPAPLLVATLPALASCSAIIDVDPACDATLCAPFACAPDGIACLEQCTSDADCTSGFACNPESQECEATGCVVTTSLDALEMPALVAELEPVWIEASNADNQLVLFASNRHGLGMRRFGLNGSLVEADPVADPLGMFPILEANPLRRRFRLDASLRVGSAEDGVSTRIRYALANPLETGDEVYSGAFDFGPPLTPPSATGLLNPGRSAEIDDTAWTDLGEQQLVVWAQTRGGRAEARLVVAPEGPNTLVAEDSIVITEDGEGSERVGVVNVGSRRAVLFDGSAAGERRVVVRPVANDGTVGGRGVLMNGVDASTATIDAFASLEVGGGASVLWGVLSGTTVDIMLGRLDGGDLTLLETEATVVLPSESLDVEVSAVGTWDAVAFGDTIGLVVSGTARGREGVWLLRLSSDGAAVGSPLLLAERPTGDVREVDVVATSDGFAAFWRTETEEATATVAMRRVVCQAQP